jgi:hypothetical protein
VSSTTKRDQDGVPPETSAPVTATAARAVEDSTPERARLQEATAGAAPKRRICWKLKRMENAGPPGRVSLSEWAANARAMCRCSGTRSPAERSSRRCIRA